MQKATPQKVPRWKPARVRSQKLPEVLLEPEPGMSPERFQKCLDLLRLSQRGLAPLLDCSERLPASWANGTIAVPPKIADWLEKCVKVRATHPEPRPPADWRVREDERYWSED